MAQLWPSIVVGEKDECSIYYGVTFSTTKYPACLSVTTRPVAVAKWLRQCSANNGHTCSTPTAAAAFLMTAKSKNPHVWIFRHSRTIPRWLKLICSPAVRCASQVALRCGKHEPKQIAGWHLDSAVIGWTRDPQQEQGNYTKLPGEAHVAMGRDFMPTLPYRSAQVPTPPLGWYGRSISYPRRQEAPGASSVLPLSLLLLHVSTGWCSPMSTSQTCSDDRATDHGEKSPYIFFGRVARSRGQYSVRL